MKFFGVQHYVEYCEGRELREKITEYINIDHIVSIEGYAYKDTYKAHPRRGYILYLSNGRYYKIFDSEYQSLIDLIEANEKEKRHDV